MLNIHRILQDIIFAGQQDLPPDPEACLECKYHPTNLKFDGDDVQHCYMFKELPETLCMQFKKTKVWRV